MKYEPTHYSRLLILVGLLPLLVADLFFGLPEGVFIAGGAIVMGIAAIVHFHGDEPRAAAGWLLFGAALAVLAMVDPTANTLYLVAFGFLLISGVVLMASQRRMKPDEA